MIIITFENDDGQHRRTVEAPCDVREAVIELVSSVDELFPGDKIVITDDEDGEG